MQCLEALDDRSVETEGVDTLVDVLITSFDLVAVVDDTGTVGGEGSNEQGNTGADVGRGHADTAQIV